MSKNTKGSSSLSSNFTPEPIYAYQTIITVMGAGGGGNNTISRLIRHGTKGIQTIAVNTDAQDLLSTNADRKILIGKNITGGPADISAQGLEGFDQHGRLNGHVQGSHDFQPCQGLLHAIFFAHSHQSGHFIFSQFHLLAPPGRQGDILNLMR